MASMKKIVIGADHAGFRLKEHLKTFLVGQGYTVADTSPGFVKGDDYPHVAKQVALGVQRGEWGILICDTGAGVAIAANRMKGVRAVPCYSVLLARHARTDNDANILCLGQETTPLALAKKMVVVWLNTKFSKAQRHLRRVKQLG